MKFKALKTLIIWHENQMHVFNPGDVGDLPESVVGQYPDCAQAEVAKAGRKPKPVAEEAAPAEAAPVVDAIEEAPIA
jgi:hypothetical protein